MNKIAEELKPGDVVEMRTARFPEVGSFRAAIEATGEGQFSVFSTELVEHDIYLDELTFDIQGEDFEILSRTDAMVAVPQEANGFQKGDRVRATIADPDGKILEGTLVAAIDNLLYCITDDGVDFSAESQWLEKVEKSE